MVASAGNPTSTQEFELQNDAQLGQSMSPPNLHELERHHNLDRQLVDIPRQWIPLELLLWASYNGTRDVLHNTVALIARTAIAIGRDMPADPPARLENDEIFAPLDVPNEMLYSEFMGNGQFTF
jgi:hypothetical protein